MSEMLRNALSPSQSDQNHDPVGTLLVTWSLHNGGAERVVSTLLNHLDRTRFRPRVCVLGSKVSYSVPADVEIHRLDHKGPHTYLQTIRRLRELIRVERPQIVMSNIAASNVVTGEALRKLETSARWIARIGAYPKRQFPWWQEPLLQRWQARVYQDVDAVIVNATELSSAVEEVFPAVRGKTDVVFNPTDFDYIDAMAARDIDCDRGSDGPVVLSVGRLHSAKRLDVMLEAFAKVRATMPAQLWVCGTGPLRSRLIKDVRRRDLQDCVRLLGFCENPFAIMKQADLFLLTSDREGLPNALIEAQGMGLPAVSTRCRTGPDEIIVDAETGFLTPMRDSQAIADALVKLLGDKQLCDFMGEKARSHARSKFGLSSTVRAYERILSGQSA